MFQAELEKLLRERLPVAKFMGVVLDAYDGETLSLTAPVEPNRNPHDTAFAGSLFSIAALSAWGLLFLKLREAGHQPDIVISKSEISYKRPVVENIRATSSIPDTSNFEHFLETFAEQHQARTTLVSRITTGQGVAAEFEGRFAASRVVK